MNDLSDTRNQSLYNTSLFPVVAFLPILFISLLITGVHLPILLGIGVLLGMIIIPISLRLK